jgi:hypothetical protein
MNGAQPSILANDRRRQNRCLGHLPEDFSLKEGVSLNQFINVAVAEKIVHLQAGGPLINPEELL